MVSTALELPKKGFAGLIQNWRHDLIAAISVALVALPLGLGISVASGSTVPPMAGVISAIIGGLVTTFIRGSHIGINGPGAGLVGVSLAGVVALADKGKGNGYEYYMAAIIMAGAIQALMGVLKWGKFGDLLPASVVRGVLAAIGIIIFASQIHVALDTGFGKAPAMESILALPKNLKNINWPIALIAVVSLAILIAHPYFINKLKLLHYIPAPMLVLLAAIPFVYIFNLQSEHTVSMFGNNYMVGPKNLIPVDDIMESLRKPNFGKIGTGRFWAVTIGVFLVSTIETIPSAKAIDQLDPYKRSTNLNKDLIGTGLSTVLAGFVGGLPVITVIVRSSLNVNHGARTKWSNFFHGLILLAIVFFFIEEIQMVPLAALAAILVFTGVKLASPRMFADTMKLGYEQVVIVAFTIMSTIQFDLKTGLVAGIFITLLIHLVKSHIPINLFFKYLRKPQYQLTKDDNKVVVKVKGISNFTNVLNLTKELNKAGYGRDVIIDFSQARLVDHTVLEILRDWDDKNANEGGTFDIVGLDIHLTTSQHPTSLHVQPPKKGTLFLSKRQQSLKELSAENRWKFDPARVWSKSRFRKFMLFESRAIEYSKNRIKGTFPSSGVKWEVCDIAYDEGAFLATEVHHSTVALISLEDMEIPVFEIEREGWWGRILEFAKREEIYFEDEKFSDDFAVKGFNTEEVKQFFTKELMSYLSNNDRFHIEGNENGLLIFRSYRFASPAEVRELLRFSEGLVEVILNGKK